ncbi:MAG TPA: DUF5916 domain-containing protein [Bacteroidales bacterium]|nr:DUF5916 domain-containing protein [Bacteroidales bacterium]
MMLTSLVSARIFGQDPVKNLYTAGHIVNPPAIDGILDDYAWTEGIWCADFTQYEPYNKKPVSQKTEFKILFDDNNIYVAVKAFDTHRDSIVRRLTRKDQVEGDVIAVVFDSYHDLRTGFFFGVSAAGVKYDLVYTNDGQNQDPTWDPDWWVRTSINDNGWVAEMKIPLSQIRFKKNSADKWGLQVARLIYRKNEFDYWQHIPKDAPGLIHMFGELNGLERIIPRKIFDITPYLLSRVETYKAERENPFRSSGRNYSYNAGVDSKIGVTNNITLDLTFNPDFGQVEADPSVVNLSAFETFYKEQRPFFVEGNNITDFNIGTGDSGVGNDNLFYSRRIGRAPQCNPSGLKSGWIAEAPSFTGIIGAAKLTGKTKNGLSVGIIDAVTNEEKAVIDTLGGKIYIPVEPLSNYFVGRMQKDYNSGNSIIGGIITGTNRMMDSTLSSFLHRAAYTGGVDLTQYFYNKNWMLNFNAAISSVEGSREAIKITQESSARYFQRPDNIYVKFDTMKRTLTGSGGKLQVMKLNGHLNLKGAFLWKTPGFEANDLGYIRQADQLYGILAAGYNQWKPKGIYNRYSINCDIYSLYDFGGNNLSNAIEQNANMTFKNYWNAYISGSATTDQLSSTLLRGGPLMKIPGSWQVQYGFSTDNRRRLILSVNSGRSGQYQKSSVSGFLNINVQYKPTNYLMVAFGPQSSTSDDNLQYITTVNYNNGKRYVFSTIHQKTISASFRVNINLLPDLSIQYWGQPFLASGKYSEYKYITNPTATRYIDRYHVYSGTQISGNGNGFNVDENCDGKTDYQLGVSNFSYQSFMSNLVVRWEYSPGSSVFFVWNQTRNGYDNSGNLDSDCLNSLFKMKPVNIFLIKFSYRFGLMFK